MKISTIYVAIIFCTLMLAQTNAQETINGNVAVEKSIKPLRIGVKIGTPGVLTLNAEYVTPLLDNRIAPFIDYLSLKY